MKLILLLLPLVILQDQVPYKPSDEFKVNIDLSFRVKGSSYLSPTYSSNGERLDKANGTLLPFLTVTVTEFKIQPDEIKIIAENSLGKTLTRKTISPNLQLHFEMGFVDDLRTKTSANEITINFLSRDKKELRKIVFNVSDTGVFTVNGEWRGQF